MFLSPLYSCLFVCLKKKKPPGFHVSCPGKLLDLNFILTYMGTCMCVTSVFINPDGLKAILFALLGFYCADSRMAGEEALPAQALPLLHLSQ